MAYEYSPPTEEVRRVLTYDGNPEKRVDLGTDEVYMVHVSDEFIDLESVTKVVVTPPSGNPMTFELNSENSYIETELGNPCLKGMFDGHAAPIAFHVTSDAAYILGTDKPGTYLCGYDTEILTGYISRIECVEIKTAPISSSLSYHEAYPEFIEHLKNRKYDAPVSTLLKVLTYDGKSGNRVPWGNEGVYITRVSGELIDLNSIAEITLTPAVGDPIVVKATPENTFVGTLMGSSFPCMYGSLNGNQAPVIAHITDDLPGTDYGDVMAGTYLCSYENQIMVGYISRIEYVETVN